MNGKRFVVLALLVASLLSACEKAPRIAAVGSKAPDFSLADASGRKRSLSELEGKVVFVNFWATWCPPCRDEMPSMQRLYERMPKDKFEMLAILENDSQKNANAFAARLGITLPILYDEAKTVWPTYGLTGVPETFIVDKKGVIREKFIGPAAWDSPRFVQLLTGYVNQ